MSNSYNYLGLAVKLRSVLDSRKRLVDIRQGGSHSGFDDEDDAELS